MALSIEAARCAVARARLHIAPAHVARLVSSSIDPDALRRIVLASTASADRILAGLAANGLMPDAALQIARTVALATQTHLETKYAPIASEVSQLAVEITPSVEAAAFRVAIRHERAMFAAACRLIDDGNFSRVQPDLLVLALGQADFRLAAALLAALSGSPMRELEADLLSGDDAARDAVAASGVAPAYGSLAIAAAALHEEIGSPVTRQARHEFQMHLADEITSFGNICGDADCDRIAYLLFCHTAANRWTDAPTFCSLLTSEMTV